MKRTSFVAAACVPAVLAVTMLTGIGVAQASELPRSASSVQGADDLVDDASGGIEEEHAGGLEVFEDITEHVGQVWAVGCDAVGYCPMELMDEGSGADQGQRSLWLEEVREHIRAIRKQLADERDRPVPDRMLGPGNGAPSTQRLWEEDVDADLDGDGEVEAEEVVQVEVSQLVYDFCVDNASGICEEVHEVIGVDTE